MGSIPTDRLLDIIVPPREGVPEKKEKKSPHRLAKPLRAVKAIKRSETPSAGIVARTLSPYKPFPLLSRIIGGSGPALDTLIQQGILGALSRSVKDPNIGELPRGVILHVARQDTPEGHQFVFEGREE
jgi:hypothetical protein